jgi:hypothetical protein
MPFKSQAQRRFMFAAESRGEVPKGTAKRWAHETPKDKKLPERVKEKRATFEAAISCMDIGDSMTEKVAFGAGLQLGMKTASALGTAAELTGLGVLAVPAAMDLAHKPKNETKGEAKMRKIRSAAELGGLGILAAHTIKSAAEIGGRRGDVAEAEDLLRSTPLGELVLADFNGKNESLEAAIASWRRMRDAGTSRARVRR